MSDATATPVPPKKVNRIGLELATYRGSKTTLCAGCGHNAISERIIDAFFEMGIDPAQVIKLSGIGCSSKSPAYFLGASHGFNSVHGRMPSVATGAVAANRDLICIGISGDGDSLSIGFGQFGHVIRRNLNMLYMIENNGVYGLTKGQFSATADPGTTAKKGEVNLMQNINAVATAIGTSRPVSSARPARPPSSRRSRGTARPPCTRGGRERPTTSRSPTARRWS